MGMLNGQWLVVNAQQSVLVVFGRWALRRGIRRGGSSSFAMTATVRVSNRSATTVRRRETPPGAISPQRANATGMVLWHSSTPREGVLSRAVVRGNMAMPYRRSADSRPQPRPRRPPAPPPAPVRPPSQPLASVFAPSRPHPAHPAQELGEPSQPVTLGSKKPAPFARSQMACLDILITPCHESVWPCLPRIRRGGPLGTTGAHALGSGTGLPVGLSKGIWAATHSR